MLAADEFFVGSVRDAKGLTLMRPRGPHEYSTLVSEASGKLMAVFLGGQFSFTSFDIGRGRDDWNGILIPNVRIEIDECVTEAEGYLPVGALIRKDTGLYIATKSDRGIRAPDLALVANLPACAEGMSAGFSKWRVVIGEEPNLRELMSIDSGQRPPRSLQVTLRISLRRPIPAAARPCESRAPLRCAKPSHGSLPVPRRCKGRPAIDA